MMVIEKIKLWKLSTRKLDERSITEIYKIK